jgi:hypothetical protein
MSMSLVSSNPLSADPVKVVIKALIPVVEPTAMYAKIK